MPPRPEGVAVSDAAQDEPYEWLPQPDAPTRPWVRVLMVFMLTVAAISWAIFLIN